MSLGTFRELSECRLAGLGWNRAVRADSHLRGSLGVHNGNAISTDQSELGFYSSELCLA